MADPCVGYALLSIVQTIPLALPFAETVGVGPGYPETSADCEVGVEESDPFANENALRESWLAQKYTLPFQYAGIPQTPEI
jgi:hypothetical protein